MERARKIIFYRAILYHTLLVVLAYTYPHTRTHMHTYIQKYTFFCAVKKFRFDKKKKQENNHSSASLRRSHCRLKKTTSR